MKTSRILIFISIFTLVLASCAGNSAGESELGMVFSEEEAADNPPEEGFDFSEDESADQPEPEGFDFTEDDPADPADPADSADTAPEMVFDEDEGLDLSEIPDKLLPPAGISTWEVKHDPGVIDCESFTTDFPASPPETITIQADEAASALLVSGMGDGIEVFFIRVDSGPGGSFFEGLLIVPGTGSEIHYEIVFTSISDAMTSDYLFGTIRSTEQGCKVTRTFDGNRVD